jgi:CSLREA domain-containing protein
MMHRWVFTTVLCLVVGMTSAATITVTKTSDDPVDGCDADCSLREAVIEANLTVDHDTIVVPVGTYVLSLAGPGEDAAATGDLDLLEAVTIVGDPMGGTVIDGDLGDRLFHLIGATVDLVDLTLTRGSTPGDFYGAGGVLVESGTLTMIRCLVSDCVCDHYGGGIFSLGTVILDRSAIVGNTCDRAGGILHAGPNLQITNTTISGNTALQGSSGGIEIDGLATSATIRSSTITGNTGVEADSISVRSVLWASNTIIDGVCAVIPGMGTVNSDGGNIESPGDTCELDHVSDAVGVTAIDLGLGPLQNNGGTTPTHALDIGSAAIDSGNDALCPATDQRDWLRHDPDCDVGSFEVGALGSLIFADDFESGDISAWSFPKRSRLAVF